MNFCKTILLFSILFSLHVSGQTRQTASVNIHIKLIKSASAAIQFIESEPQESDKGEIKSADNTVSYQRNVLINYNNLFSEDKSSLQGKGVKKVLLPIVQLKDEYSGDNINLNCNSNSMEKKTTSKQNLLFEFTPFISNKIPSESLAITVVY